MPGPPAQDSGAPVSRVVEAVAALGGTASPGISGSPAQLILCVSERVGLRVPESDPRNLVSVVPGGMALAAIDQRPTDGRTN